MSEDSSHTHNFWYLYAFILILILYSHCSYSKFEVPIILILNNTHDVIDFDFLWLNIYKNHKISMILIKTPQYSVERCVLSLLAVFGSFFLLFFVNATITKNVIFNERFESLEPIMSIISIFLNLWIWMSRLMHIFRMLWVWCQCWTHTHCNLYL